MKPNLCVEVRRGNNRNTVALAPKFVHHSMRQGVQVIIRPTIDIDNRWKQGLTDNLRSIKSKRSISTSTLG